MNLTEIIHEESPWFILLCLMVGAIYSYFLYNKQGPWSKTIHYVLAGLRFTLVALLCYLLLVPLVRQTKNLIEEPIVVLALDNSKSMELQDEQQLKILLEQLQNSKSELEKKGYSVELTGLDELSEMKLSQQDSGLFTQRQTNISSVLKRVTTDYENRNLVATVLVSDGINNNGLSPEYLSLSYPVFTVGFGDTTQPQDVFIPGMYANRIAYLGNSFPIKVEVGNKGYQGEKVNVRLLEDGKAISTKSVTLTRQGGIQEVDFQVNAGKVGKHQYAVTVQQFENEENTENNRKTVYVEVVDGRQKILIAASAPHPDIRALKSVIAQKQNYQLEMYFDGGDMPKGDDYDLVIYHQIPAKGMDNSKILEKFSSSSKWYFTGSKTDYNKLNQIQNALKFGIKGSQTDNVQPVFNPNTDQFNFESELIGVFGEYPPVEVPFGEIETSPSVSTILKQRIGSIETDKPLLCVANGTKNNTKLAFFIGEGMWKWRMMEYAQYEKFTSFDQLMGKTLQYASAKTDKRKLRVFPVEEEFSVDDNVQLDVEVYNDILEPVYGKEINLKLTSNGETSQYSFVNSGSPEQGASSRFSLGSLKEGVYNFVASTSVSGKTEKAEGSFVVKETTIESLSTSADFELLRKLADQNAGTFYQSNQLNNLTTFLIQQDYKNKVISSFQELKELINLKWIFFVLLGLATLEWVIRKYHGII